MWWLTRASMFINSIMNAVTVPLSDIQLGELRTKILLYPVVKRPLVGMRQLLNLIETKF